MSGPLAIGVKVLENGAGLPLPAYQSAGAAGLDLFAAVAPGATLTLPPGGWRLVPTGLALAIPADYEGQIRPRSGLAAKAGVTVLNAPGTIDSDYRGEIGVILINHGEAPFEIVRGARIAQIVFARVVRAALFEVADLDATERGVRGFGSTGRLLHQDALDQELIDKKSRDKETLR
jgi:dUTP pyrophosphatase